MIWERTRTFYIIWHPWLRRHLNAHTHSRRHTLNSFISEEQIDDPPQGDIDQEAIDLLS